MDLIHKNLVSNLDSETITNFITHRHLTFKNAGINIAFSKPSYVSILITLMIESGDPKSFIPKLRRSKFGPCSINTNHKDPLAQKHFYRISINNEIKIYCNNCIDNMIRFSCKMVYKLGDAKYKKLMKIYLLVRKSSLYFELDNDCFNNIVNYLI